MRFRIDHDVRLQKIRLSIHPLRGRLRTHAASATIDSPDFRSCDDTRPASTDKRGSARSVRRIDAKEHSHNSHGWPERYLTL